MEALTPAQAQRHHDILRAAGELLDSTPYDQIQMKEVAEKGGVALGTLYRYFGSKEHLYAAVLAEWAEGFYRPVRTGQGDAPAQRLRARLHRTIRAFERNPNFVRLEIVLQGTVDPQATEVFGHFVRRNLEAYRSELSDLPDDLATDIVAVVTAAMARELMAFSQGWRGIDSVYRITDRAIDLIFAADRMPSR